MPEDDINNKIEEYGEIEQILSADTPVNSSAPVIPPADSSNLNVTANKIETEKLKADNSTFMQNVNKGMNDPKNFTKTNTFKVLMVILAIIFSAIVIYFLYKFLISDDNEELKQNASQFI